MLYIKMLFVHVCQDTAGYSCVHDRHYYILYKVELDKQKKDKLLVMRKDANHMKKANAMSKTTKDNRKV